MSARTTRQEARSRIFAAFSAQLDRMIPENESVPLKGANFAPRVTRPLSRRPEAIDGLQRPYYRPFIGSGCEVPGPSRRRSLAGSFSGVAGRSVLSRASQRVGDGIGLDVPEDGAALAHKHALIRVVSASIDPMQDNLAN
jgi:hypothetical protein